jgi:hypothetical protein
LPPKDKLSEYYQSEENLQRNFKNDDEVDDYASKDHLDKHGVPGHGGMLSEPWDKLSDNFVFKVLELDFSILCERGKTR